MLSILELLRRLVLPSHLASLANSRVMKEPYPASRQHLSWREPQGGWQHNGASRRTIATQLIQNGD